MMYWVVEYVNGKSISENDIQYKYIEKNNIKNLYYICDNDLYIGVNLIDGIFFINKNKYDFKILT